MRGAPQMRGRAARLARLLPTGPASAARTPFVLLVVLLLGGGLIALLMLNSSLNEGSFRLSKLKKETTELTDQQQELQRKVDGYAAPDSLERRARELGLVPGANPAFLNPDGTVRGAPSPAAQAEPSTLRAPAPAPTAPAPQPSASPGGAPSPSTAPDPEAEPDAAEPAPSAARSQAPTPSRSAPVARSGTAPAPSTTGR
ncbi:cell division protein FtsL [Streptomyces monticola]|uniref:Cell division protein FtsL n=1 Tax=Streptomyces monticola TaxID=2666263 RepID=A0ABW2JT91_9ACTN